MQMRSSTTTSSVVAKPSKRRTICALPLSSLVQSSNVLIRMQPMKSITSMSCDPIARPLSSRRWYGCT
eukprot:2946564-Prymnesium_polylepis.1